MGFAVNINCSSCGYDKELWLGSGMQNPEGISMGPVYCESCSSITKANFNQAPLLCERCQGGKVLELTNKRIWKGDGEGIHFSGYGITSGHYKCPKCGKFMLQFSDVSVLWD